LRFGWLVAFNVFSLELTSSSSMSFLFCMSRSVLTCYTTIHTCADKFTHNYDSDNCFSTNKPPSRANDDTIQQRCTSQWSFPGKS
jgi:hypothetical protein